MGRKPGITRPEYEHLVLLFSQHGYAPKAVSKACGRSEGFLRRAWGQGWSPRQWWALPIKERIDADRHRVGGIIKHAQELAGVNSNASDLAEYEWDKKALSEYTARARATESLALTEISSACRHLIAALGGLARKAELMVVKVVDGIDDMDAAEAMRTLKNLTKLLKDLGALNHQTMASQRLHLGEPGAIAESEVEMSDEDMMHRLQLAAKAYERLQAKRVEVPAGVVGLKEQRPLP